MYTDQELIDLANRFKDRTGEYPKSGDKTSKTGWSRKHDEIMQEMGFPNQSTFQRRFGSINKAWDAAAGHTVNRKCRRYSTSEMVALLALAHVTLGFFPSADSRIHALNPTGKSQWAQNDVCEALGMPIPETYRSRFGSMAKAKARALELVRTGKVDKTPEFDSLDPARVARWVTHRANRPRPKGRQAIPEETLLQQALAYKARAGEFPKTTLGPAWKNPLLAKAVGLSSPALFHRRFGKLADAWAKASALEAKLVPLAA